MLLYLFIPCGYLFIFNIICLIMLAGFKISDFFNVVIALVCGVFFPEYWITELIRVQDYGFAAILWSGLFMQEEK